MFRRNADTIQGTCDTCIESPFDFVELKFDFAFESAYFTLGFIDLGIGRFKFFFSDYFFCLSFQQLDQP